MAGAIIRRASRDRRASRFRAISSSSMEPAPPREPLPAVNLTELKRRSPAELLRYAEELGVDSASTLKKSDLVFAILKRLAETDVPINGEGVLEILQDGFGFLRSPDVNYVAGPDDIYVSPSQIRRFALRTGDVVQGQVRAPKEGERYFALLRANTINFDTPEVARHRVHFDNLTPYYPTAEAEPRGHRPERQLDPDHRDRGTARQGPAGADRGAATDRQDDADAEHRACDHGQSPGGVPDRAAHRRAARRGHRHAAHGARRGGQLDLRRAGDTARAGRGDGDREGQAPGRARSRRRDPARFDHPVWRVPTTPSCRAPARC